MNLWTSVLCVMFLRTMLCVSTTKLCCDSGFDYGCTVEYNGNRLPKSPCPNELQLEFSLYTELQRNTPQTITKDFVPSHYTKNSRAIFIVHGFGDSPDKGWVIGLKDALLDKGEKNIIVVNWSAAAQWRVSLTIGYPQAAANTYGVALALKAVAKKLESAGTTQTNVWCIGHSLGAHLCGHAGDLLKFGRITGLDPAGPLWDNYGRGLNKNSATFVDVIHTDGSGWFIHFGLLRPLGHADFYPNEGSSQPACKVWPHNWKIHCSHMTAVYYFTESVKKNCFKSTNKCDNYEQVTAKCPSVTETVMGYGAVSTASGMFYVPVSKSQPYCKG